MSEDGNKKQVSAEFMLKEYERLYTVKMNEDAQAEQRVNFFLTVASAAVGIIILISQVSNIATEVLFAAVEGVLVVLLLFGLVIFSRLNVRPSQQRAYSKLLEEIQGYFARLDPEVTAYLEVQRGIFERPSSRFKILGIFLLGLRGSLTVLMILGNSLLCSGIVLTFLFSQGYALQAIVGWTTVTFVVSGAFLSAYHQFIRRRLPPFRF